MPVNQPEKNSQLLHRIGLIRKEKGFKNDIELAKAIEMSSSYLYEITSGKKNVPKTMGQRLEDHLGISRKWFETGEGEMFKESIPTIKPQSNTRTIGDINYPIDPDDTPFIDIGDGQYIMVVPLVNEYAYAGYLAGYRDQEYIEELPKHTIIVNKQHRGHYQAFEVVGDSMENYTTEEMARESIQHGSVVTGRQIKRDLWSSKLHTHRWRDFVIVHKDGILTKRIIKHDTTNGIITLHSLNPDKESYPDREVHLDDVHQIFNIVQVANPR